MSDILRQVDEDLRKDRLLKIWKLYGIYIVSVILIGLISLAGYQYYLSNTYSKNEAIVAKYIDAINSKDLNSSINQLSELDNSDNSYIKGLSQLKRAEIYVSLDQKDQALKLLQEISVDSSLDQIIKDLALYKYLMLQLTALNKDQYIDLIKENHLNESQFKYLFKELKGIKFLIEGETTASAEMFDSIILDQNSPNELKLRSKKFKIISEND